MMLGSKYGDKWSCREKEQPRVMTEVVCEQRVSCHWRLATFIRPPWVDTVLTTNALLRPEEELVIAPSKVKEGILRMVTVDFSHVHISLCFWHILYSLLCWCIYLYVCRYSCCFLLLELVTCCFEPSQPQRITSGLNTNFTLSQSYSFHKSSYHKSRFFRLFIFREHF